MENLKGLRKHVLLYYNVLLSIVLSGSLICLVVFTPQQLIDFIGSPITIPNPEQNGEPPYHIWFVTMLSMIAAGGLAGVLRNLHGYYVHIKEEKGLPKELEQTYYLRPLEGAILGLFVLFIGHLITSSLSQKDNLSLETLTGRMPYIGIALFSGFAAPDFIGRMKAVAETLFGERQIPMMQRLRRLEQLKKEEFIDDNEFKKLSKAIIDKEQW